ncbi:kinesin-like protein KIN-14F isoform X2 [Phalaenopsis equestris]|uniref:kinesin-like protein KIN-14F isoform X2 n=1 Tax=Phalaenopsis equestris TaxID=78828 RepID=UPI0009E3901D|nr:kinesin-like protein KIN-14F isoform X2 [Phalaenopsis equestris]
MASEGIFSISVASVLEDVLKEHGKRFSDLDLVSRKAEEAAARRYEVARWLRKTVGVVGAKDLPEEPSEEEFRLGLRSGLILCNALNKVQPAAVPKIVASSGDSVIVPDGAALSAYQYFENVRNFLVAVQEIGLPTFEVSDLEQGGKNSRIVNCVLALKSYGEWRQMGGGGSWRLGGNAKPATSGKAFMRKNFDPFSSSMARSQSLDDPESFYTEQNSSQESREMPSSSLNVLVHEILSDKKPEEVPALVESMLNKFMKEFGRRIASQNELVKTAMKGLQDDGKSFSKLKISVDPSPISEFKEKEVIKCTTMKENFHRNMKHEEATKEQLLKQYSIIERQQRGIQFLRHDLQTARAGMEFMQKKYLEELKIIGKHMHCLANAASGYHKVIAENRRLYNQVQDLKGSIRVYCRVRPFLPGQMSSSNVGCIDDESITIITPAKYGKEGRRTFTFNKVFGPAASQEEVFSDTQPLIRSVLDGYNVCIFAYGQTGSGKTFTMSGAKVVNAQNMGVNYRALSDLFNLAEERRGAFTYNIGVQMIEIYNEQVRDLLVCDGLNRRLEIRNGTQNGVNVPDANLVPVTSTSSVIELMNIGLRNRAVGATALNDRSSRSHSCLTVHVQGRDLTSGTILHGCMHLVDLAGSERVEKTEVTGERLKEAQHINKSLSALGDVIYALAQNHSHVPYRNSKLTQLLQDSLGGQAKTLMFVHISPEMDAIGETISTLKFAERVSKVELGAARINKEIGESKELKEQVGSLRAALAKTGGESEQFQAIIQTDPSTLKTRASSPAYLNKHGVDFLSFENRNHRQPMEEVGNIEARSNPGSKKKPSFDLQDLLMGEDSLPWSNSSPLKACRNGEDDKDASSGDWVDKVMVNKNENSLSHGDGGNFATPPDFFYQRYVSDSSSYQDQPYSRSGHQRKDSTEFEIQRHRFDSVTTDDSDDLDVATSDSSEADALWQFNLPKSACNSNSGGSKVKKPPTKPSPDFRTPTYAYIPSSSSSKKISSGPSRISRQLSCAGREAKRTASGGKLSSGK